MEDLRGSPLAVGNLEEMIDDNHAIVSSSVGPEYYVGVLSFVNQDLLEPGCTVLLHNKVMAVVGILSDDTDPMVSVMKVEKAPLESYADIGGLESQIQVRIARCVRIPRVFTFCDDDARREGSHPWAQPVHTKHTRTHDRRSRRQWSCP